MLPNTVRAGTTLAHYELVRPIGSGGGGSVFEAIDATLGRPVALKVFHVRAGDAAGAGARFLRESRIAVQIRHPHVVDVFDVGVHAGVPFLVMELVAGETLAQLLAREPVGSLARTVEIVLPIVSAVAELHANGVVHRDIKPSNILMAAGGAIRPQLTDFGVSLYNDGAALEGQSPGLVGTPGYMAPEAIRSPGSAGEFGDQYAIGALLYECATGKKPVVGATRYEQMRVALRGEIAPPSAHCPLPAAFDEVVLRAMHSDPQQRFSSVAELGASLLPFAAPPIAARWTDDFVSSGKVPPSGVSRREASKAAMGEVAASPVVRAVSEASMAVYDGVATLVRGDTMIMLWSVPARLPRTQWSFDVMDRLAAQRPDGIVVLMIILPTADPPDRPARQENERRIRRLATRVRRVATVVLGDGAWQVLVRTVMRAMVLPHRGGQLGPSTVECTIENGLGQLLKSAGPATPSHECLVEDVRAAYAALGLQPPEIAPPHDRPRRMRESA
jgi:hypothetical protein